MNRTPDQTRDSTEDEPLVGVPDHPVGAVAGSLVSGAVTGAVVGTAAGPVGTAIGAVAGALVGAMGGDAIASSVQQAGEADRWRAHCEKQPYFSEGDSFDDYAPAFEYGSTRRVRHPGRSFDEVEPELAIDWESMRGASRLNWDRARHAARDAWGDDKV